MDDQWQPGLSGGRRMEAEIGLLRVSRRMFVIIVQARLADPDHLRMRRLGTSAAAPSSGSFSDSCGCTPTLHHTLGNCSATAFTPAKRFSSVPMERQTPTPAARGAFHHRVQLSGIIGKIQMAMTVHEHLRHHSAPPRATRERSRAADSTVWRGSVEPVGAAEALLDTLAQQRHQRSSPGTPECAPWL